jgi:hypothetical protein
MTDSTLPIDAELIEAARHGQVDAFGSLAEWHVQAYQLPRQLTRSRTESDDLVSEGFVRGAEHFARRPRTRLGIPRVPADRTTPRRLRQDSPRPQDRVGRRRHPSAVSGITK